MPSRVRTLQIEVEKSKVADHSSRKPQSQPRHIQVIPHDRDKKDPHKSIPNIRAFSHTILPYIGQSNNTKPSYT
ncbi:MAG: hypothetical protein CL932_16970 [Deltaproteobacteria bacterium]|nr:hypothetical protein [Deltaproteobacteria bacterium]